MEWDFSGNRNVRRFVELCARHGLHVIVRLGPFCHGEVRNGGLPDWLYGKSYEVRSLDAGFLDAVRGLYAHIAQQLRGLYFKDGDHRGPGRQRVHGVVGSLGDDHRHQP